MRNFIAFLLFFSHAQIINAQNCEIRLDALKGAGNLSDQVMNAKTALVDVQLVSGMFVQQFADEKSSAIQNKYTFREVTFPFYAILSLRTLTPGPDRPVERFGIEIQENGSWSVQVGIDN